MVGSTIFSADRCRPRPSSAPVEGSSSSPISAWPNSQEDAAHDADVHRHDAHVVAAEARIRAPRPARANRHRLAAGRVARRAATAAAAAPTATTARGQAARGRRRLGIGLARRDGEVGNAEGADVIGHDADLRTGRGFIPDVADLLAVDDEARRAGHSTTRMRSEPSSLATFGTEAMSRRLSPCRQNRSVFLSAVSSSRHRPCWRGCSAPRRSKPWDSAT